MYYFCDFFFWVDKAYHRRWLGALENGSRGLLSVMFKRFETLNYLGAWNLLYFCLLNDFSIIIGALAIIDTRTDTDEL